MKIKVLVFLKKIYLYIFDKFYRGSRPDIVNMRGTGLGLSISKQIVEAHGGEIKVESKVGKGTKVVFNIPINGGQHEEDINRR
ncbi:MAG: Adaptive-response sensory-kinase SasA [Candidatus Methanoperedenaceae archaeon GB37]|nr:MAG: Adaptive-response sensory-kinase SasA [Candidatus Methanoperedenaceae archaeon GB37]